MDAAHGAGRYSRDPNPAGDDGSVAGCCCLGATGADYAGGGGHTAGPQRRRTRDGLRVRVCDRERHRLVFDSRKCVCGLSLCMRVVVVGVCVCHVVVVVGRAGCYCSRIGRASYRIPTIDVTGDPSYFRTAKE